MLPVSRSFFVKGAFYIVGPTASGKSEIAAEVAARCRAEIVSADAFQIYRGLPLLTAQPDESVLQRAPHHLVAELPLNEPMSAEKFRRRAISAITEINSRGKLAIVVGGSGLYLKAVTHGLAPLPAIDQKMRAELNSLPLEQLVSRLLQVDPSAEGKTDLRNRRRVVRALEIFLQTKVPASDQRSQWGTKPSQIDGVLVYRDRADLCARIDRRVEEMFAEGVTGEVERAGDIGVTAAKTIGLDQIQQLLSGKINSAECVATIQQMTRRYAKRQLTWFRRQTNFEPLNLSLLKDHSAAVDSILQKVALLPPFE
jgi:tRNA dimethylallyltransferase